MRIVSLDIRIACEHCGAVGKLPPSSMGRLVKCSKCGQTFRAVPDQKQIPAEEPTFTPVSEIGGRVAPQRAAPARHKERRQLKTACSVSYQTYLFTFSREGSDELFTVEGVEQLTTVSAESASRIRETENKWFWHATSPDIHDVVLKTEGKRLTQYAEELRAFYAAHPGQSNPQASQVDFNPEEFDLRGLKCPHCGNEAHWHHNGRLMGCCKALICCGGRQRGLGGNRETGLQETVHFCPICRVTEIVERRPYDVLTGEVGRSAAAAVVSSPGNNTPARKASVTFGPSEITGGQQSAALPTAKPKGLPGTFRKLLGGK